MDPTLSTVIAVWSEIDGVADGIRAFHDQADDQTELIVVANVDVPPEVIRVFPGVRWLRGPADALVPHLWALGMVAARGQIVAITTSRFTPAADWVRRIREAHARSDAIGIGGPIDPPRTTQAAAWATYFLRYSGYFHLNEERAVSDMPGDNASYKRDALQRHWPAIAGGFWEPEFHRLVLAEGGTLSFVPAIRLTQRGVVAFRTFCRQRFLHGRQFGATRIRGRGAVARFVRAASAPLIPGVFLAKITRRVLRHGRDLGSFLRCSPVLVAFVLAWVAGELAGYITASAPALPRGPARSPVP